MSLNQGQMLAVLNALPDPVFVLTASGCYAGLFGHADPNYYHDGSDLMGSRLHDVLPAEVADWVLSHVQQSLQENGLIKVEYPLSADQVKGLENQPGPDGMIWFEGHIQPFPGLIDNEPAVIWVARNITRRKILEEQLIEHSKTDPLTQAGNRRRLMEALDQVYADFRRYNRPAALIMFDIDHFKRLNDKFATSPAITCCRCSARSARTRCVSAIFSPVLAVRNSSSCCRKPTRSRRPTSLSACAPR